MRKLTRPARKGLSIRLGSTLTVNYVEISDLSALLGSDESISVLVVSKGKEADSKAVNDKVEVFKVESAGEE